MRKITATAVAFLLVLSGTARAAFQFPPANPQALAMGNSSMAAVEDSAALFMNPAGMSRLQAVDLYMVHNQLYAGMSGVGSIQEGLVSFGVPTRFGSFGAGFGNFKASGLKQERTIAVGWAKQFGRVDVGVVGKQLYHSYDIGDDPLAAQDPVFHNGTSKSAFALDLGLIAQVYGPLKLGLAARNINRPDVGLATEDRVESEYQAGLSYELADHGLRFTTDLTHRPQGFSDGRKNLPSVGVEKSLHNRKVMFRAGISPLDYTAGFGLRLGRVGFDYALILRRNMLEGNAGTHSFGVRVQFGGPKLRNRAQLEDDPDSGALGVR